MTLNFRSIQNAEPQLKRAVNAAKRKERALTRSLRIPSNVADFAQFEFMPALRKRRASANVFIFHVIEVVIKFNHFSHSLNRLPCSSVKISLKSSPKIAARDLETVAT